MVNLMEEAKIVGDLLRNSAEYQQLLHAENAVENDLQAHDLFDKYKREQNRIRNNSLAGKNPSEDDISRIKDIRSKMENNELIMIYENASTDFNSLLQNVNLAIEQALSGMEAHTCTHCGKH